MEINDQKVIINHSNVVSTVVLSIFYNLCSVFPPEMAEYTASI